MIDYSAGLREMIVVRRRPSRLQFLYGPFASQMIEGTRSLAEMRDRAAYMYITGCFPSHLRKNYTAVLREISRPHDTPTGLDKRVGYMLVRPEVVTHLTLEQHPMVLEVREKIAQGYLIQISRGFGTRRNFSNIFMFKFGVDQRPFDCITVKLDGAIKQGWK